MLLCLDETCRGRPRSLQACSFQDGDNMTLGEGRPWRSPRQGWMLGDNGCSARTARRRPWQGWRWGMARIQSTQSMSHSSISINVVGLDNIFLFCMAQIHSHKHHIGKFSMLQINHKLSYSAIVTEVKIKEEFGGAIWWITNTFTQFTCIDSMLLHLVHEWIEGYRTIHLNQQLSHKLVGF